MSRYECKTCNHPRSSEINMDLLNGMTCADVLKKYGDYASVTSVANHRKQHLNFNKNNRTDVNYSIKQRSIGNIKVNDNPIVHIPKVTGENKNENENDKIISTLSKTNDSQITVKIDDLILDAKVKHIVLTTLKELGIK